MVIFVALRDKALSAIVNISHNLSALNFLQNKTNVFKILIIFVQIKNNFKMTQNTLSYFTLNDNVKYHIA